MQKIKGGLKSIIPEKLLNEYRLNRKKRDFKKLVNFDSDRFEKYAYDMKNDYTFNNLRAKINFHAHGIEKGLSNANFRFGFGRSAFEQLFLAMDIYLEKGYPIEDNRFQNGLSSIFAYVERHKNSREKVPELVEKKFIEYQKYLKDDNEDIAGAIKIESYKLPDFSKLNFEELAMTRRSIRDYGTKKIVDKDIVEAIELANQAPSVCNRQMCKVYYVKDLDTIEEVMKIQRGLRGNGENLQGILLVTANKEYVNGPHERNQTYIDGGIFSMALLYALTYKNIASCPLNADFNLEQEREMRNLLPISEAEDFIMFASVGSYPDEVRFAKSPRDQGNITII